IITNAGGPSVMAVDMIEEKGLLLSRFSEKTINLLKKYLPPVSSINNPVDILGDAKADRYEKAIEAVLSDENVDGIIVILTPQIVTQPYETAQSIVRTSKKYEKCVISCFMGGKRVEEGIKILKENGIPNYPTPERAVIALKGMDDYRRFRESNLKGRFIEFDVNKEKVREKIENLKRSKTKIIGDIEGREILFLYGINVVSSFIAKNEEECENFLKRNEGNFVMKLISPDIIHKTEAGGVKIGIKSPEEAKKAFKEIIDSARKYKPDAKIVGVQIQKMIEKGIEVIIGVSKDVQFGHLIMFGLGGIYVEILKDVSFRIAPLTDIDADEMVNEIKSAKILKGYRNIPECNTEKIKETILKISQLVCDFPEIKEMDINPLIVNERDAIAVDVRFVFEF
ncbi:MAG: acetate--CoA ligase family protein, partial [Candidatus Omnitrophica bacterium]|nr:acetate--CoA ligase family protein [Candidatus Omnitrophota bacterium]